MASNQTSNYKLNQWAAEDRIIREEFNEDNSKVEAALTELANTKATQAAVNGLSAQLANKYGSDHPYIVSGNYTGTGTTTITVTTGFKPSLVMLFNPGASAAGDNTYLVGDGSAQLLCTVSYSQDIKTDALQLVSTGFTVNYQLSPNVSGFNEEGQTYHYIAFR